MKRAEILLFLAIVAFFIYVSSRLDGFLQDDAFIFARYAQNILNGNGFVYNAGEYTEGATSLLWTLLGALGGRLGADIPQFLKGAGFVSALLWLVAFLLLCRQWLTRPWQWVPPVLVFAAYPALALWSQGGLETCFFGFLTTLGFYLVESWHQTGHRKTAWQIAAISSLLILTRPEGLPVVALYGLYLLLYPHPGKRTDVFKTVLPTALATLGGLLLFRYLYFHDVVPNTYYAKGGGGYYLWRYGLGKFNVFLGSNYSALFFALSLPVLLMRERIRIILLMVPLWAAYFIKSGGDILPEHRLLLPAFPFMVLGTFYFFDGLRSFYATQMRERYYNTATLALALLFAVQYYTYQQNNLLAFTGVRTALERAHGEMGRYLNTHMQPGETAVLTDAGMTALYAQDKHMVDWLGLCDKRVAHILYDSGYNAWAMSYCTDAAELEKRKNACWTAMETYFRELNPRYVVLNVFLDETTEDQVEMIQFYQHIPDSLTDFVIRRISFDRYFGIFDAQNHAKEYKPVLVTPYNPNFWMVLVEKRKN